MSSNRNAAYDEDMALDLMGLLKALGAAMRWLLPLVFCVALGTFLALQFVSPKYKGAAQVLIESKDANYPGAQRGVEGERALLDNEGVASQVQLLMSADLARRVAKRLDLSSVPEFDAESGDGLISDALAMVGFGQDRSRISPEERVLKVFYKNLDIYLLDGSRVIAVEFSSKDPELAAAVANTIVDEYMVLQSRVKRETTEFATSSLEPQIERLKKEVQAARKAVKDFRASADLFVGADNLTLHQQQLAEISSSYSQAQADKAEAQAKAELIRSLLSSGSSLETASDVLDSLLIQRLRERQVEIQSNIAELSITLLPNHPQLKALQSQLSDYNRQIRAEARKILSGLENDAKVAAQQSGALKSRLDELKKDAAKTNEDQVRLAELEREANAKARQLDGMINSFRDADTRLRAQALPADARIISRASIPIEPYAPKVMAITIVAALATFVLGCAFVIMREFMSGKVLQPMSQVSQFDRAGAAQPHGSEKVRDGNWGHGNEQPMSFSAGYSYGGYRDAVARYVQDYAAPAPSFSQKGAKTASGEHEAGSNPDGARQNRTAAYEHNVSSDWQQERDDSKQEADPAAVEAGLSLHDEDALEGVEETLNGLIVVLSIDDFGQSHDHASRLARMAASEGYGALLLEVFPEQENPEAAPGFADLVAGETVFSKVVYEDAQTTLHIIEAGTMEIDDTTAEADRFLMAMEAIQSTYETIVVDLGVIDSSLASATILQKADRVLLISAGPNYGQELKSAARLLSLSTGAEVEIIAQSSKWRGKGWAA